MKRIILLLCAVVATAFVSVAATPAPAQAAPAWPVLREGSSGANVTAVQQLLTARGYATTADGAFGPATKSKVVSFQSSRGLTADGIVGTQTWGKLVTTVQYGANNTYVRAAQTLLNKFGYRLTVDGAFGVNTRSATISFQKAVGISADGIIGPVTWQYLAGTTSTNTNPVATNCSSVTGPVPVDHTTVITGPTGYSFRVHKCLAPNLDRLLDAAYNAGYTLGGWGYRSYDQQVALRKQNCGTSYYAIYQMPSSQCSPPTAIPGRSMHERGLAVDFNSSGSSLTSGAFNWLSGHAASYGLYNYPAERWHWSTNGN